jgi:hypothetical protein
MSPADARMRRPCTCTISCCGIEAPSGFTVGLPSRSILFVAAGIAALRLQDLDADVLVRLDLNMVAPSEDRTYDFGLLMPCSVSLRPRIPAARPP